jgi:hypothetical protein
MKALFSFIISISIVYSLNAQENCANALTLTPGTQQCGNSAGYSGDFPNDGSQPSNFCYSNYNDDEYWFEYTPSIDGALSLNLSAISNEWVGIFVFDDCPTASITCLWYDINTSSTDDIIVTTFPLTIGTSYKIVIVNYGEPDNTEFCLDATYYPFAENDDCTNATQIVCGDSFIAESTLPSLDNGDDMGCDMGAGVWYEFEGVLGEVTLSVQADAEFDHKIAVASSSDCISFVSVDCVDIGFGGDLEELTFIAAFGTTYYFYVGHYTSEFEYGSFDISVSCVYLSENDDCDIAIPVAVEESFLCGSSTSGTLEYATASLEDNSVCSGTEDDDVWFSFVASKTEHRIEFLNVLNGTTELYHSVWEGTCGGLILVPGSCSDIEESNVSGLTIGNTYYLRVYSNTDEPQTTTFDVCIRSVSPSPVNDECDGAISVAVKLDLLCESTVQGTTESATASPEDDTACPPVSINDDVWYSFVAKATEHQVDLQNVANGNGTTVLYHSVWEGTCGGLSLVSGSCSDLNISTVSGLTIGNTYYLRIYSSNYTTGQSITYDLCIGTNPAPPPNDDCINATSIACEDNFTSETTINASDNGDDMGCDMGAGVWYEFQGVDGEVTLTVSAVGGFDHEIAVASTSDCIIFDNVDCKDIDVSGGVEVITFTSTSTETYYFFVGHYASATIFGAFDISVSCVLPPDNDECATASVLAMNTTGSLINQTFAGATDSGKPAEACDVDSTPTPADVWYSIDTDADGGNLIVIVEPGPNSDVVVAIYNACGDAVPEQCVDLGGNGGIETINFAANFKDDKGNVSTTRDANYFVRVYEKFASGELFEIGAQGAALPIVLGSFEAKAENRGNRVEWTTLSEINSDYVEVQSSPNGSTKWEAIGKVQTNGESLSKLDYELFDNNPYEVTYYRLNAVDKDGKSELSHSIYVKREDKLGKMSLSPNPANSSISLQTFSTTEMTGTIVIHDMTGNVVKSESVNLRNGLNTYSINLDNLNTGIYLFTLRTEEGMQVEKIVKQ